MKKSKYIKYQKECPICKIIFETVESSKGKTTCSCSCANKFFRGTGTQKRKEINEKIKVSLTGRKQNRRKTLYEITCGWCQIKFQSRNSKQIGCCVSHSSHIRFSRSDEREKIRQTQIKLVENGMHHGWKSRNKLEPSYPEKFFIGVLKNENIVYEREFKVGMYFIDFALNGKIALEIDGKQHLCSERQKHDKKKDIFLQSLGWIVFRIPWKNLTTEKNKEYMKQKIFELKRLYLLSNNMIDFL
jgi:very-short-patch-repair endonuclease